MNTQKFIELIPEESREIVKRAVEFAGEKHASQNRPGGESQMDHLIRVAVRAAQYAKEHNVPFDMLVVSALLHDAIEDTSTTADEIKNQFGNEVAGIVQAVSHEYEEELDEIYLQRVAKGGRLAILVKRFDRLDNLESLCNTSVEFRSKKIQEVQNALPIWREIDPEGAKQIENMLEKFENPS